MPDLYLAPELKHKLDAEAARHGFRVSRGGGSQRGLFIQYMMDTLTRLDALAATYEQQGMEDALALLRLVYTPPQKEE